MRQLVALIIQSGVSWHLTPGKRGNLGDEIQGFGTYHGFPAAFVFIIIIAIA
jgi:hypothetical protein